MFTPRLSPNPTLLPHAKLPNLYEHDVDRHFSLTADSVRTRLIYISAINAVLSLVVIVMGYYAISEEHDGGEMMIGDGLKVVVGVLSVIQLVPIVIYWGYNQYYMERLRFGLHLSPISLPPLHKSPSALTGCLLECLFHLIILPPFYSVSWEVHNPDSSTVMSLSDLLYILVLLRNYHSLRFLFWMSDYSTKQAYHFASVANIDIDFKYTLKAYLQRYSLKIVLAAYGAIVVVSGLSVFVFERESSEGDFDDVRNSLWFIAYTQVTIGYGDISPTSYLGMLATVVSCFVGNFILAILVAVSSSRMSLNLTECTMYSELVYSKEKRKYAKPAAVLIQAWWRFMLMRKRRVRDGEVIIKFYSQLRKYREVLTKCQLVKDRRFERQITAFDDHTAKHLRAIIEYLDPIRTAESYV